MCSRCQKGTPNLIGHIALRLEEGGDGAWFDHTEQCSSIVIDPYPPDAMQRARR